MARPRKNKPVVDHLLVHEEAKTEWQKALNHLEDNYKLYLAGAVFLLLCAAVGAFIRLNTAVKDQEASTAYAEAVLEEDAALRLEKYGDNMDVLGRWSPEALYRMGETAIEAEEYDRAEEIFTQFTATYPGNEYLPNVVDGLAFLAWNKGDLEAALQGFERVAQEWPGDFVGRRKYYDIGQVLEELDRLEDAIAAYKKQIVLFPESSVQRRSQQALDALKEEHPDLFPEEEGEEDIATEETAEVTGSEGEVVNVEAVAAEDTAADEPVLVVEEENIPVEEPVVSVEVSTDIPVTVEEPVVSVEVTTDAPVAVEEPAVSVEVTTDAPVAVEEPAVSVEVTTDAPVAVVEEAVADSSSTEVDVVETVANDEEVPEADLQ